MAKKTLLVIGGAGALGRGILTRFHESSSWKTLAVDYVRNDNATKSFLLETSAQNGLSQTSSILNQLEKESPKIDAIVCAAGGWTGGSIKDTETLVHLSEMYTKNVASAVMASHLASHLLSSNGLLVLTGAAAALKATPGMTAYGMSKAATHHLVADTASALPKDATVLGILPVTIDTPMNRKFMADADFSSWTKVHEIATQILKWTNQASAKRPKTGHLFTCETTNNLTTWKDIGNPFL